MKQLCIVLAVVFLQGCSMITVDELEPTEQQEQPEQPEQQEQPVVSVEPQAGLELEIEDVPMEEEQQRGFLQSVGDFFGIDWSARESETAAPIQYLALGDSLTRGVGDEKMEYGYTERLSEVLETWPEITEVELDNRGKNGRRSNRLLALIERGHYDQEIQEADLITMTIGGNDVMRVVKSDLFGLNEQMFQDALPGFKSRYEQMIGEIRKRNADVPIIMIGFYNPFHIVTDEFTPFETIIAKWNTEIQLLAEADVNACFVPVADLFVSNEDLVYHSDFFHPNGNGYDRMTTRIIETMQDCNIEQMSAGRIGFEE